MTSFRLYAPSKTTRLVYIVRVDSSTDLNFMSTVSSPTPPLFSLDLLSPLFLILPLLPFYCEKKVDDATEDMLQLRPMNLKELVRCIARTPDRIEAAQAKNVMFLLAVDARIPDFVMADRVRLRQVNSYAGHSSPFGTPTFLSIYPSFLPSLLLSFPFLPYCSPFFPFFLLSFK